jgi:predicted DsbA family dithiol-disulfide isomerase
MILDIFSDPVCPWCFVGKRRLERALAGRPAVQMRWRCFRLNPGLPADGLSRNAYLKLKFGGLQNAERLYDSIAALGAEIDIAFDFDAIQRTPNTLDCHRLIYYAEDWGCQSALVERLFTAYFQEGQDLGDRAVLAGLAAAVGMPESETLAFLSGEALTNLVLEEDFAARRLGISGVPFFLFAEHYGIAGAQPEEVFHRILDVAELAA